MFPLVKGIELLVALLLLSGRLPALALLLLAPIVVNIVAFHAFLAPTGSALGFLTLALRVFLARQTGRPSAASFSHRCGTRQHHGLPRLGFERPACAPEHPSVRAEGCSAGVVKARIVDRTRDVG